MSGQQYGRGKGPPMEGRKFAKFGLEIQGSWGIHLYHEAEANTSNM